MTASTKYNTAYENFTANSGFFSCLFGCTFADEKPKIPKMPKKPVRPAAYEGLVEANFTMIEGYGLPTSGILYPFTGTVLSSLNIKYFGVLGQGFLSGFSYDKNKDVEGKDGILDCSARYIHLSLLPNSIATADLTGNVGTAKATKESKRELSKPFLPPLPGDFKAKVVLMGGAASLAVSSVLALATAISLY